MCKASCQKSRAVVFKSSNNGYRHVYTASYIHALPPLQVIPRVSPSDAALLSTDELLSRIRALKAVPRQEWDRWALAVYIQEYSKRVIVGEFTHI